MAYSFSTNRPIMGGMSERKRSTKATAEKPGVKDRKVDRHKKRLLPGRADEALRSVLDTLAASERRSLAQMVELLLEEALRARGLWPPRESS